MQIARAGDRAVLIDLGDVPAAALHGAAAAVRAVEGVVACIVGQRSLYVVCDGEPPVDALRSPIAAAGEVQQSGTVHRIAVSFRDEYGPDLAEFLSAASIGRDEFISRVGKLRLVARYIGFRGGFAYLDGWPAEWSMPRRPTSRPRVARGTFAIAGSVAGFYPIDSPGGWNLLGRTAHPLEHALEPGDEIHIEPTLEPISGNFGAPVSSPAPSSFPLKLTSAPLAMIVTRRDWSNISRGIPPGGPFDRAAAMQANRAVGNEADAPLLECAAVGPTVVADRNLICSWAGARAEIRVNGRVVDDRRQFAAAAGDEIRAGRIHGGLRGYLAAGEKRGEVEELRRNDRLTIEAMTGPHDIGVRELVCEVTPQLDRVGIRMRTLAPEGLTAPPALPSCGVQCGTIQLHPDGSVVAMGPDHPVTGGYLQPVTVISSEVWKLAQLVPGDRVRFVVQLLP